MKTKLIFLFYIMLLLNSQSYGQDSLTNRVFSHKFSLKISEPVDSIINDIKRFTPKYIKEQNVPGVSIALIFNNQIVWNDGFGYSNSITKNLVDKNTLFEVASNSKVVTAYIALKLVDKGILSLDKPLLSYLSKEWMPYSIYQDSIKLKHVLSHTSGLSRMKKEIMFNPGSEYYYSANGFNLLMEVMEETTGETFEELAQCLVFQPLGMKNSSFVKQDELLALTANGHIHAIVPVAVFGLLYLVLFLIISLVGLLIIRWSTKSWKLRCVHRSIFIILPIVPVALILFIILGEVSLFEFAYIILITGFAVLAIFLILFYVVRVLMFKFVLKKIYQRVFSLFWGLLLIGLIIFISMKVRNLPIPIWPNYKASPAGTLRTTSGELALFLLELANPKYLKVETARNLSTSQIKLAENLSWGMGPGIFYSDQGYALWQWGQHIDFQSIMIIYPQSGFGIVVCTNNDLLNPDVALEIAQHALGVNIDTVRAAIHLRYNYSK